MCRAKGNQEECKCLTHSKINTSDITAVGHKKGIEKGKIHCSLSLHVKISYKFLSQ